jgi:hypothetical protein
MVRAKVVENRAKALAYLRTSSAQNVGGDSDQRQREAITRFATAHGHELVGEFYDAAVSGADPIESRPGFAAMLERIEGNGVGVVIVEDASRFARSVIAQELGVLAMQTRGVMVLTANGENLTETDGPAKVMMRQARGRPEGLSRDEPGAGPRGEAAGQEVTQDRQGAVPAGDCRGAGEAGLRQRQGPALRSCPGGASGRELTTTREGVAGLVASQYG